MRNTLALIVAAALLGAVTIGCTSDGLGPAQVVAAGAPTQGDPLATLDPLLGDAINAFGFDLLAQSASENGNAVVSPLSAHAALAMTYNGAKAETAGQMAGVLHLLDLSGHDANAAYADLLASLAEMPEGSGTTLAVENSIWTDVGFELLDTFAETDRKYFGAQLESLDLQGDGAPDRINGWVAERTGDKITELVDEIPSSAVIYLVNAVYLNARWVSPFDPGQTAEEPFSISADEQVDVPMMRRGGSFLYAEAGGTQAVRLPYEDGRLAMWVVLPAAGGGDPRDVARREIARLGDGGWGEIVSSATDRTGSLVMPTFTSRTKTDLAASLAAMGMPLPFDPEGADFSKMSPRGAELYISRVLHETYIDVDEQGTEAAAATAVEGLAAGVFEPPPPTEPFSMTVDRPFLFAIQDAYSGAMLFLGVIANPLEN